MLLKAKTTGRSHACGCASACRVQLELVQEEVITNVLPMSALPSGPCSPVWLVGARDGLI
jgi:hypothetical protein